MSWNASNSHWISSIYGARILLKKSILHAMKKHLIAWPDKRASLIDQALHCMYLLTVEAKLTRILFLTNSDKFIKHLRLAWLSNINGLLLMTPDPITFVACIYSNCWVRGHSYFLEFVFLNISRYVISDFGEPSRFIHATLMLFTNLKERKMVSFLFRDSA